MIICCTITLTISVNNVIVLINFVSILFVIGYELLGINCVEITLLIVIIYCSAFLCLFLINGFMFMSSFYIIYYFDYSLYCIFGINSYFSNLFVIFPCIWSVIIEYGWNRFGNVVFDNDLLILTVALFWGVSFNLKSLLPWLLGFIFYVALFTFICWMLFPSILFYVHSALCMKVANLIFCLNSLYWKEKKSLDWKEKKSLDWKEKKSLLRLK